MRTHVLFLMLLLAFGCADAAPADQAARFGDDDSVVQATWTTSAGDYRGRNGLVLDWRCPPGGEIGRVWGTGIYTDDSSVCTAAVHAGLIGLSDGGLIALEIAGARSSYEGSDINGVATSSYDVFEGSFLFPES